MAANNKAHEGLIAAGASKRKPNCLVRALTDCASPFMPRSSAALLIHPRMAREILSLARDAIR
jgi:hypothetical protein